MAADAVRALYDFSYWANWRLVALAADLDSTTLHATPGFTYRSLLGTLIHILDVEWSWRIRLRNEHPELWDTSLSEADLPTIETLTDRWAVDEAEMRSWLAGLTDDDLARVVDLGNADRFPLWYYLIHVVTHSEQQRRDVQLLLRHFGIDPPDLEFLYYADSRGT